MKTMREPLQWLLVAVVASMVIPPSAAFAQAQAGPLAVVQRYVDAHNRNDRAGLLALLAEDVVQEGGPCMAATGGLCVGKAAYQRQLESGGDMPLPMLRLVGTQVSGTTVTARYELRLPSLPEPLRAQGVERLIETETIEVRGGQITSLRSVLDTSDPQTARALAFFNQGQAPQPVPAGLPRTGGAEARSAAVLAFGGALASLGAFRRSRRSRQGA